MTDASGPGVSAADGDAVDTLDAPLAPSLVRAVAALRPLPATAPETIARVIAAAERQADARRTARRRTAGTIAAIAAGLALCVVGARHHTSETTAIDSTASGVGAGMRTAPSAPLAPMPRRVAAPTPVVPAYRTTNAGDAPRVMSFHLARPRATSVTVVGDFNEWNIHATPLVRGAGGTWTTSVALTPGRHAYRFVVDDSLRVLDPRASSARDAELGVAHSVLVVGVP